MERKLTKRTIKSAETKTRIIEAGKKILRQYGYQQMTIEEICTEAKVSTGSFYHFFKSKQELINHIFPYENDFMEWAEKKEITDISQLIDIYIEGYIDTFKRLGAEAFYMTVFAPYNDFIGNKSMYVRKRPIYSFFSEKLLQAKERGELRQDEEVDEICDEIVICGIGVLYWVCTTEQTAEEYAKKLQSILYPLIERFRAV
ncbi:MAG: TetR/AcrR family transcriptional regulator [Clostridiales bacterium]|nr:TetR/AcrR family transcriptional regulator [Clostridiales bacterium]